MKTICCVCQKVLEEVKEGTDPDDGLVSHGYCQPCADRAMEKVREEKPRSWGYIDWESSPWA